jgi:hypothetical protein
MCSENLMVGSLIFISGHAWMVYRTGALLPGRGLQDGAMAHHLWHAVHLRLGRPLLCLPQTQLQQGKPPSVYCWLTGSVLET